MLKILLFGFVSDIKNEVSGSYFLSALYVGLYCIFTFYYYIIISMEIDGIC